MTRTPHLGFRFAVWCWGWDGAGDLDGPDVEPIWELMVSVATAVLSAARVRPYLPSSRTLTSPTFLSIRYWSDTTGLSPTCKVSRFFRYGHSVRGKGVWTFADLLEVTPALVGARPPDMRHRKQGTESLHLRALRLHSIDDPCLYYHSSRQSLSTCRVRSLCFPPSPACNDIPASASVCLIGLLVPYDVRKQVS